MLGLVLVVVLSIVVFLSLPVWAWGDVRAFLEHPAQLGTCLIVIIATASVLFTRANLGVGTFATVPKPWTMVIGTAITLGSIWLPPFADRRHIATFDGDPARYAGLVILTVGCILRVGPMFALGRASRRRGLPKKITGS